MFVTCITGGGPAADGLTCYPSDYTSTADGPDISGPSPTWTRSLSVENPRERTDVGPGR